MQKPRKCASAATIRTKVAYWDDYSGKPQLVHLSNRNDPLAPSLFYLQRDSEQMLWDYDAEELLQHPFSRYY